MRGGCGPEIAGPPHTTAGGGGRVAVAGPRRPRGGSGAENVPGLARPRPLGGGGAGRTFGWARRANARWCSRAAGPVYMRGRAGAVRPFRRAWPPACAFPARMSRFLELRPVGENGFLGRAPARDPRLRGARRAVGWRRRHEGAQVYTPAARRGGGREASGVRRVAGWALPALVTSPDRSGETSWLCGLGSGPTPLRGGRDCSFSSKNAVTRGPSAGWVLGVGAALLLKPSSLGL